MSNRIVIEHELCTEDRARIDRLIEALDKRQEWETRHCHKCVERALEVSRTNIGSELKEPTVDALQERLAETLNKAFKATEEHAGAHTDAQETDTLTTTPLTTETSTGEAVAAPTPTRTATRAELRAKVVELSAKGLKEQARQIVTEYAPSVPAVPEDKITECYDRLVALGG